ncbi:MarR family winged helix-turn-helix transcriptional regulator [Nocardioides nitrophenolicus]|uniref:MarR family winged helix-turn-helix transcriptional regulator n=1 Tax=Nocardioides nitrophenolicus TaxID=60489 RepID=UPI001956D5C9|nr:MarR family transcriptional regulator [Nocardioides nitrophenolicus]MBM7517830.1 DNA-binding MarR family transcriptional regulator [Nocardioides nitrophenolicus]
MSEETRWLDPAEMAAWLPLVRLVQELPQAIDRRLREEVGITHTYYAMLATLSAAPDRMVTMGELARLTATSPSRLTHAVAVLEERGWVTKAHCPSDRRSQFAVLTDEGQALLDRIAPGHLAQVRELVFDRLTPEQVRSLAEIATALVDPVEAFGEA